MTLRSKILLIFAVMLILVVVVLAVAILVLPESDLIRNRVQDQLRRLTGQEVLLGSLKVSVAFPDVVNISLAGVSVQTSNGEQLFSADRVLFSPALFPLLRGEVVIRSIVLQRFRTSVVRGEGGTIQYPFVPVPTSSQPKPVEGAAGGKTAPDGEARVGEDSSKRGPELKWSIKNVSLEDGRIDWIDRCVSPGQEVVIPVQGFNGRFRQMEPPGAFAVNVSGKMGDDKADGNEFKIEGSVQLSAYTFLPERVRMTLSTKSLSLEPFYVYYPPQVPVLRKLGVLSVRSNLNWERGRPPLVSFDAALSGNAAKSASVELEGEITPAMDLSRIQEIRCKAEANSLPLKLFAESLPFTLPLDPADGTIKGSVKGQWSGNDNWRAEGSLLLANIATKTPLNVLGERLRVWTQFKVKPGELLLENLEVSDSAKIASISGKIGNPFSGNPELDLNGDIPFTASWLTALGFALPQTFRISAPFPIQAHLRGKLHELLFDLNGDLAQVVLSWLPYLEKPAGAKGTLSAKGKVLPTSGKLGQGTKVDATVRLNLAGTGLRLAAGNRLLSPSFLHLDARIAAQNAKVDVKEAVVSVRKGTDGREFLAVRANVMDIGSPEPRIEGRATVACDSDLLTLAGLDAQSKIRVKGTTPVTAKFSGGPSLLQWSVDIPLSPLALDVEPWFRKAGGVSGDLRATGKWAGKEWTVEKAALSLPGIALSGRGLVRDRNGHFGTMTFDLKKSNLDDLLRYIPGMKAGALSGSVEGSLSLKTTEAGIVPDGSVRLASCAYRPDKAEWSLEQIKGIMDIKGDTLLVPEIVGKTAGFIEAPFRVNGSIKEVGSLETLNGDLSIKMGPGRIKAERLRVALNQARVLVGTLLDPKLAGKGAELLDFTSLTADVRLASGSASTDNLQLKGQEISAGAIGGLRLDSLNLDMLLGLHTVIAGTDAIGKIPAVKEFVKKHEDLLKITGLHKELKRLGITPPDSKGEQKNVESGPIRTPVTLILKMRGPVSSPQVSPVLESAVDKNTLTRLKSLID